ncbi:hypothetical protein F8388_000670 [Cannabis sativa]|uniref:Uncharacterized protein n=1 Tax=Cannabis sativa TaxID=3483 RepID=A0A7J6HB71_CANSA|nr:hypothetical protein F8388_000670 [Cannabis sativa]
MSLITISQVLYLKRTNSIRLRTTLLKYYTGGWLQIGVEYYDFDELDYEPRPGHKPGHKLGPKLKPIPRIRPKA